MQTDIENVFFLSSLCNKVFFPVSRSNLCCFFGCSIRYVRIPCTLFSHVKHFSWFFLWWFSTNRLMFALFDEIETNLKENSSRKTSICILPENPHWNFVHTSSRGKVVRRHKRELSYHHRLDRNSLENSASLLRTCLYRRPSRCMAQNSLLFFSLFFLFLSLPCLRSWLHSF